MSNTIGDFAEVAVMKDLLSKGYIVSKPWNESQLYDLVVDRNGSLEKVQVKKAKTNQYGKRVLIARCRQVNRGKIYKYTSNMIDWLAIYDPIDDKCYYISSEQLGDGKSSIRIDKDTYVNKI